MDFAVCLQLAYFSLFFNSCFFLVWSPVRFSQDLALLGLLSALVALFPLVHVLCPCNLYLLTSAFFPLFTMKLEKEYTHVGSVSFSYSF